MWPNKYWTNAQSDASETAFSFDAADAVLLKVARITSQTRLHLDHADVHTSLAGDHIDFPTIPAVGDGEEESEKCIKNVTGTTETVPPCAA